ncbi:probable crossover junction endonuclease EME2 isoform X1 [Ochotona princeps]|uniref:probable crossover junction endonuclease EME2 isoform X1 n=1 Tax=Ochotona princeps TaxID=9978 RepID=UPI002714C144|nr:probable crossover junction endonuclease EME2 isoform X1 [Ochotona princeps]
MASARGSRRAPRRPPTWEISDSDTEGPAGAQASTGTRAPPARALRPEQALRRLVVGVDPAILQDPGADVLLEALGALGCQCLLEPQRRARSLRWSGAALDPCPRGASGPLCSVPWISAQSTARQHLAVIGLDAYLWCRQSSAKTQTTQNPVVAHAEVPVSRREVQEALVHLQLWADLDVLLVTSWQELSQHVCAITRALAQHPIRWHRECQSLSFCTTGRWAAGVRVTRDGHGLREAWRRQIMQFNRASPAVADSIVAAFPAPRLLQQALATCTSELERQHLLADLPVKGSTRGRPRRVGPDLARRLCLFLSTVDPDLLLDLGS